MKIIQLAIRTLCRFKIYTIINIIGLALSMACVIIIFRYVEQELTVDSYIPDRDRIAFQIQEDKSSPGSRFVTGAGFSDPDIECSSTVLWYNKDVIILDKERFDVETIVADSNFVKVMKFPVRYGNIASLNDNPQNVIITQILANKLFGDRNPIGEKITYSTGDPLTVTGVISMQDRKSSIHFDLLVSDKLQEDWVATFPVNVVLIRQGANLNTINQRHAAYETEPRTEKEIRNQLLSINDSYFDSSVVSYNDMLLHGSPKQLQRLSLVAILVLLIGIFNFMSLYTVILLKRGKEFGLKKIFGSTPIHLFVQLYIENLFLIAIALCLSWFLIEISTGFIEIQFGMAQQKEIAFDGLLSVLFLLLLPGIAVIYPFLRYRHITPVRSLQSIYIGNKLTVVRYLYLSVQYVITFTLIVLSLFFVRQLYEMLHTETGYTTDNIIRAEFQIYDRKTPTTKEEFRASLSRRETSYSQIDQQMNASPLFTAWGYNYLPYEYQLENSSFNFKKPMDNDYKAVALIPSTESTSRLYGFKLLEGRLWNDSIDQEGDAKLILNRKAMSLFGFKTLSKAELQTENPIWPQKSNSPYQIIGVIEDFYCGHLSIPIGPIAYMYCKTYSDQVPIVAAIVPGKQQEAIAFLDKLHHETMDGTFEYAFVQDEISNLYREDRQITIIYSSFALLGILISSLGLFGLSLFDIQQRYREVALRKVNGAMMKDILPLLLRQYILILGASFVIAIPLAYWGINVYLENYAYRTDISWWLFALAAIIVLLISLVTLIYQVRKAIAINPATILKGQ